MDQNELLERVQAARARAGKANAATMRQQALDDTAAEVAAERATTLARLGRRLDAALVTLAELEARAVDAEVVAEHARVRSELLEARWEMTVVREAMGLRGVRRELDETWPVPPPLR